MRHWQEISFKAQLLRSLLNILEAMVDTGLDLLFLDIGYALVDGCSHVRLDALDKLLQHQVLVLGFDLGKVGLDAVEGRAVRHVEDQLGIDLFAVFVHL